MLLAALPGLLALLIGLVLSAALLLTGLLLIALLVLRILILLRHALIHALLHVAARAHLSSNGLWLRGGGNEEIVSTISGAILRASSDAFVDTPVIDQRRTGRSEMDRFNDAEDHIVARHHLDLDHAAVTGNDCRAEDRSAGCELRPFAHLKPVRQHGAGAAGKHVGDRLVAGGERVDAEHPVGGEQRAALALAVEAHE